MIRAMALCIYCGDTATDRDHVLPVSFTHGYRVFIGTKHVPACRSCNNIAGPAVFKTAKDKAAHIAGRLREKSARLLQTPHWDEAELLTMSPTMAASIKSRRSKAAFMRDRLSMLDSFSDARALDDAAQPTHGKPQRQHGLLAGSGLGHGMAVCGPLVGAKPSPGMAHSCHFPDEAVPMPSPKPAPWLAVPVFSLPDTWPRGFMDRLCV